LYLSVFEQPVSRVFFSIPLEVCSPLMRI